MPISNVATRNQMARTAFTRLVWLFNRLRDLERFNHRFTRQQLADEYETSTKSLDRDLEVLRNLGVIETQRVNEEGPGRSGAGLRVRVIGCPWCGPKSFDSECHPHLQHLPR